jgi:hypothetical protein
MVSPGARPVKKIATGMKQTAGALRQEALSLRFPLLARCNNSADLSVVIGSEVATAGNKIRRLRLRRRACGRVMFHKKIRSK